MRTSPCGRRPPSGLRLRRTRFIVHHAGAKSRVRGERQRAGQRYAPLARVGGSLARLPQPDDWLVCGPDEAIEARKLSPSRCPREVANDAAITIHIAAMPQSACFYTVWRGATTPNCRLCPQRHVSLLRQLRGEWSTQPRLLDLIAAPGAHCPQLRVGARLVRIGERSTTGWIDMMKRGPRPVIGIST